MIVFDLKHQPEPKPYRLTGIQRDVFLAALLASGAQVQRIDSWSWLLYGGMSYSDPYIVRAEKDAPLAEWQRGYDHEYSESGDIIESDAMELLLEQQSRIKPLFETVARTILVNATEESDLAGLALALRPVRRSSRQRGQRTYQED